MPSHCGPAQTRARIFGGVFADAGGEYQRVEAAERRGERAKLALSFDSATEQPGGAR
jgi:hypothetical protein